MIISMNLIEASLNLQKIVNLIVQVWMPMISHQKPLQNYHKSKIVIIFIEMPPTTNAKAVKLNFQPAIM